MSRHIASVFLFGKTPKNLQLFIQTELFTADLDVPLVDKHDVDHDNSPLFAHIGISDFILNRCALRHEVTKTFTCANYSAATTSYSSFAAADSGLRRSHAKGLGFFFSSMIRSNA